MSVSTSKRVCIGCVCVSVLTGVHFPFMMGNWYAKVDDLNIVQCLLGNSGKPKIWPFIYCVFYLISSFIWCVIITSIQVILHRIRASQDSRKNLIDGQNSTQKKHSKSNAQTNEDTLNTISIISKSENNACEFESTVTDKRQIRAHNGDMKMIEVITKRPSSVKRSTGRVAEKDNVKITLTFCIITCLLIVSYTPHLAFNTFLAYQNYYGLQVILDRSTYTLFSVLQHFVAINGILNPFVYFFNDNRYRNLLKETLVC